MNQINTFLYSLLLFTLLFIASIRLNAQSKTDSLLFKLEEYLNTDNTNEAKYTINQLVIENYELNSTQKGRLNLLTGRYNSIIGDSPLALKFFLNAEDIFIKDKDSLHLHSSYQYISRLYFKLQAYSKALEYVEKSNNSIPVKLINFENTTLNDLFMAWCYYNMKDYKNAEEKFRKLAFQQTDSSSIKQMQYCNMLASTLENQKKYTESIDIYQYMIGICSSSAKEEEVAALYNNIAYNYILLSNYSKAKEAFQNIEKRFSDANFTKNYKAIVYLNIGVCYQNTGEVNTSLQYFQKALAIQTEEKNIEQASELSQLIALTYFNADDLYNAIEYSNDAVNLVQNTSNPYLRSSCYKSHSKILQAMEDHQAALEYYSKHLMIEDSLLRAERDKRKETDDRLYGLDKSEKDLKIAIAEENVKDILIQQMRLKEIQREQETQILKKEYELEQSEKMRIQQSLKLIQQQNEALLKNQAIENLEKEKQLKENELQLKEAQEKEQAKAFELLKSEKEKQSLEMQKQELTLEKQAERQKRLGWMMGLAVIIVILVVLFLIHASKKNKVLRFQKNQIVTKNNELNAKNEEIEAQAEYLREANAELTAKNEEISSQRDDLHQKNTKIEQQQHQIISSIQYAKRIQEAVLPEMESLRELLPSHFVLFRPRDIVSGDFYWIKQLQNCIYVVVADCTGHGVPGAFMSMLGTAFLNEITGTGELLSPSEILDALREKVKKSLRQVGKTGEAKDGMDLVLVKINLDNLSLEFSGAHNSVVHIRTNRETNEADLTTLKGDKMPIGIGRKETPFTNQTMDLLPNDMIYLFSDGYIDQFGGENKMKYMSGNFKKYLQTIYTLPPETQKNMLSQNIDKWRGSIEQIDDILVMGIRFTDTFGKVELF